jgi:hypothetical protein
VNDDYNEPDHRADTKREADEADAIAEINRDLDEMQRQRDAERAYAPDVRVDWCGESEPY